MIATVILQAALASTTPSAQPVSPAPSPSVGSTNDDSPPSTLPPDKPESPFTHSFRVGPSAYAAYLVLDFVSGEGVRMDYSFQKGLGKFRWHVIASIQIDRASYNYFEDDTPYSGLLIAGFVGTGVRYDAYPKGDASFITEFDGTIGGGMLPTINLLGFHWALGGRFGKDWELLLSMEVETSLICGSATAALMLGKAF